MSRTGIGFALLALAVTAAVAVAPGVGAPPAAVAKPHAFKISLNGRVLSPAQLTLASDAYITVKAGPLHVTASWKTNLRGTGYVVTVFNVGHKERRVCATGTSCSLSALKPLKATSEFTWAVKITKGTKVLSTKYVCIIGKA